ncbi:MAG: TonB-dependent receptor [Cyanobacteria bacterium J06638_28]
MKLANTPKKLIQTGLASVISIAGVAGYGSSAIANLSTTVPPVAPTHNPDVTPQLETREASRLLAEAELSETSEALATGESDATNASGSSDVADTEGGAVTAPTANTAEDETTNSLVAPNLNNQVQILSPTVGTILDIPAATVILQYPEGTGVTLRVNGVSVDTSLIGRTATDPETKLVTQTWYGVPLAAGDNALSVTPVGSNEILTSLTMQVRGAPVELRVATRGDSVAADGRSTLTVQGQLLDENGNTSNWDTVVTLAASDGTFVGTDYAPDTPGFQVQAINGRYTAELQSSLDAQLVQLEARASGLTAYNQVQFITQQRPTLITGVLDLRLGAEGTNFYGSRRDFLAPGAEGYELDFTGRVFATGNIGEWLFTGAYDSDRALNEDCAGETTLFRQDQSCDNAYPIYGDDSSRDVLTPSTDSIYLRFERTSPVPGAGSDYFAWGDYNTEEFATASQLYSGISRSLHGFKTHYNLGNLAFTGFYGNNVEGFQRDTIAPDGTSGTYFLSQRPLVAGSEEIYIELEELDRPGTVLERQRLYRGTDYEIDYDRGSILFRDPVLRTEVGDFGAVLVRRIVATYQFEGNSNSDTNIYGGRLQYSLNRTQGQESWLGATYVQENQGSRNFTLFGADARIALGEAAAIIAEYSRSRNEFDLDGPVSGSAYRVEVTGDITDWLSGRAYLRHTDAGFSNLATESFRPGQTRYGTRLSAQLSEDTTVRFQFDREENRGTAPRPLLTLEDLIEVGSSPLQGSSVNNNLTTLSLGVSQQLGDSRLELDWIHREREDNAAIDRLTSTSDQIRTRVSTEWGDGLTTFAQNELNVSSDSDPLYPNRTLFGMDWQLMPGISLGVSQVFLGDNLNERNSFTAIDLSGDYSLGADTTIRGQFSLIDNQQIGGSIGFDQGFTLSPGLRLDLSYEHVFNNRYGNTAAGELFSQPFAVGSGASALQLTSGNSFSAGLSYTDSADFQASTRLEHRMSSQGSNTVVTASALGRLTPAISTLFDFRMSRAANQGLDLGTSRTLKLGMAYRNPQRDNLNAFLRYEYRKNPSSTPDGLLFGSSIDTSEHLFSGEVIYAPNWRWEIYGKYAFRTSSTRIGGIGDGSDRVPDFTSSSAVHLAQLRATYRLGYSWDITGEARWIGTSAGFSEYGTALELGYYMTPDLRLYAGYSLGGAYDRDFSGANRSNSGPYIGITAKLNSLFDGFGIQDIVPEQQQESLIETANTDRDQSAEADSSEPGESEATNAAETVSLDSPESESPRDR